MEEKKIHDVEGVHIEDENGITKTKYQCKVCKAVRLMDTELKGLECGGLPPLGFGVGDKAPSKDKFGG